MSWSNMSVGWREGLLALVVLILLYMALQLWRMRRLSHKPKASGKTRRGAEPLAEPVLDAQGPSTLPPDAEPAWVPPDPDFARDAFMDGVERELDQMRDEVDALRGAVAALREEMGGLRAEFQQESLAVRAVQNTSPLYSDAMQMAMLGHDAITIAERCGIARAEAELVVALVKNRNT